MGKAPQASHEATTAPADAAPGTVQPAELVKAGCGFRYDPDSLGSDTGFNFETAKELLEQSRQLAEPAEPATSDEKSGT